MTEKLLEKKLREEVKKLGGLALKFFSASFTGMPDRIILMPGARVAFAEIKTTGKTQSPRQRIVARMLRKLGFRVDVIDTLELLTDFLNYLKTF